jgi:hypothetical protein
LFRGLWDDHALPPSWAEDRTPHELLFLFGRARRDEPDPVAELYRLNHVTNAGTPPAVPHWLMRKVPRAAPKPR